MPTTSYTKVKVTTNAPVAFETTGGKTTISKVLPLTDSGKLKPFNLKSYKPREEQFPSGSAKRQSEILDMMISPGIVKGLKNFDGIRYLVDGFKSFIEGSYKYQFGQLANSLDESNKFVRCILNEPFIEDMEKSMDPLFKKTPNGVLDLSYLPEGGNKNYSTIFLTKFNAGAEKCFFYGSGLIKNDSVGVPAGLVSNLFIAKTVPFDVVANTTGYIDDIDGIEINPDDDERKYMEHFNWNPIVKMKKGFTIYGNLSGQKAKSALQQIHNSELLAYIKESLYNMSKGEAFKKGTYDNYLSTEVEVTNFMEALVLADAIKPNPVVICNASNNTTEISKNKIKLVHIEFEPIDCLEKIVFDLVIN